MGGSVETWPEKRGLGRYAAGGAEHGFEGGSTSLLDQATLKGSGLDRTCARQHLVDVGRALVSESAGPTQGVGPRTLRKFMLRVVA